MERLLVVSPLDVAGSSNSRTHHLVRHLAPHFRKTFAISKVNITHKSLWEQLPALVRIRTEIVEEGTIRWIAMSPLGNVRHGLSFVALGLTNPYSVPRQGIRRILRRGLSTAGGILELGIFFSLIITYVIRIRGCIDVVIGQGPWEVAFGIFLRSIGRVRLAVYDDIDYAPGFLSNGGLRKRILKRLERFGIRRADLVISVGNRLACLRREQGARHVEVIPNGVDVSRFGEASVFRRRGPHQAPTLIYMGYLGAWGGIDLALDSAALAVQGVPSLHMILLGHGTSEDLSALRTKIQSLGLDKVVEYRGSVAYGNLPDHLKEADIGIAMFRPIDLTRYAFPLKVIEYMSAGLPVVTTVDTEAADIVIQAEGGVAVPFEAKSVADAIVEILNDRERYRRYSENAKRFSEGYDWRMLMQREYEVIERASQESLRG